MKSYVKQFNKGKKKAIDGINSGFRWRQFSENYIMEK